MGGNLKNAFKLFAIAATAAGLMALAPAEVQAKGAATSGRMSAHHVSTTGHVNSKAAKATDDSGTTRALNRMSAAGRLNTNGLNASHRNFGRNRATYRRTAAIAAHSKGATHLRGGAAAIESGAGGRSATHMSATGRLNTNGPNASDRDFGKSRAADRMSASGAMHSKGVTHATHIHSTAKHRHLAHHHTIAA
jgi:hypothetical protein